MLNIQLENDRVLLQPLKEEDFEALYAVASDPKIWEQHPSNDRWKKDVFRDFFDEAIKSNGAYLIIDKKSNDIAGWTRYYNQEGDAIMIGYTFYATKYWGTGFNPVVKSLMLEHIFKTVKKVQFQVGAVNKRSQIAVERLGAIKVMEEGGKLTYELKRPLKIHCYQHVPFEDLGCIKDWIKKSRHELTYTRFYNKEQPAENDYDLLIILGGPMGVYDEDAYPWLKEEKVSIKAAIAANKPIIGICLGAQLIADVLGAKVYPNKEKEIGWFGINTIGSPIWGVEAARFPVFHWHGDTFDLPEGATLLASSGACPHQAYLYKEKVLGLQFHFEVTQESLESMLKEGQEELAAGGTYVQDDQTIRSNAGYISDNNQRMFQILDYFTGQYTL